MSIPLRKGDWTERTSALDAAAFAKQDLDDLARYFADQLELLIGPHRAGGGQPFGEALGHHLFDRHPQHAGGGGRGALGGLVDRPQLRRRDGGDDPEAGEDDDESFHEGLSAGSLWLVG